MYVQAYLACQGTRGRRRSLREWLHLIERRPRVANRWLEQIRETHQLTVFPGSTLTGSWSVALPQALSAFNALSSTHGLGVTLTRASAPVNRFMTGANVQIEASNSSHTFADTMLGPQTMVLPGLSGALTRSLPSARGGRIGQSLILVPTPLSVMAGPTGQKRLREAGNPVKVVILVHELIHACGLDNPDHASVADPDVFSGTIVDDPDPNDPDKDREELGSKGGVPVKAPPLLLSSQTVTKIQAIWLLPNPVLHFPRTF